MRRLSWLAAGWVLALSACTPTLDWREVRPDDSGAVALFPCKPTHHARKLMLAGQEVLLHLVACSAGDATWALAFADLGDPARMVPALDALRASLQDNLGAAGTPTRAWPLAVDGATPSSAAGRVGFDGQRPDGQKVQVHAALFAKGTRAFQASVIGVHLPTDGLEAFFDGLRTPG